MCFVAELAQPDSAGDDRYIGGRERRGCDGWADHQLRQCSLDLIWVTYNDLTATEPWELLGIMVNYSEIIPCYGRTNVS